MSEFQDEYSESLEREQLADDGFERQLRQLREALLNDEVRLLGPSEPVTLGRDESVQDAIEAMASARRAGVLIVDARGRLVGIFTERDVLSRVVGPGRDLGKTKLSEVMTPDPEALSPQDRICYAVNRMNVAGYRTIPLVDDQHRPIGIVTVNDIVRWLTAIFPDDLLNIRPGDRLKNPQQIDAG
jgi:CBS domain-containing protein